MRHAAALLLLCASPLAAQESADTFEVPPCAESGISRIAMTVPPGQTEEEVTAALQAGALPAGMEFKLLASYERPRITNVQQFRERVRVQIQRFLRSGLEVDGNSVALVQVDEEGVVREVTVSSGNRVVDRGLQELWRGARFAPVVVDACRVPAYLHVTLQFASTFEAQEREMQVQMRP